MFSVSQRVWVLLFVRLANKSLQKAAIALTYTDKKPDVCVSTFCLLHSAARQTSTHEDVVHHPQRGLGIKCLCGGGGAGRGLTQVWQRLPGLREQAEEPARLPTPACSFWIKKAKRQRMSPPGTLVHLFPAAFSHGEEKMNLFTQLNHTELHFPRLPHFGLCRYHLSFVSDLKVAF